jgi:hypothetical protein
MEPRPELLPFYLELIDAYIEQGQPVLRDYFVLLAAEAYLASGQEDEAEILYAEFSAANADHVLAGHASMAAAVNDPEANGYLVSLRQNYPEDVVRDLVQEARNRRDLPVVRRTPEPDIPTIPVTQPVPVVRVNNPPNRGPGNPVPNPRPQPTVPPRRDPVPRPQPVPVRPQPATVPQPAPSTPNRSYEPAPSAPPEDEPNNLPFVHLFLLLVLLGAGVYLVGWTLARPFLH